MSDQPAPSTSTRSSGSLVGRRAVLTSGLAVAGGALLSTVSSRTAHARPRPVGNGSTGLDVSGTEGLQTPKLLRLKLDDTDPYNLEAAAGQLLLTTNAAVASSVVVNSTRNRVDLSTDQKGTTKSKNLAVRVTPGRKTVVWVFPHEVGEPGEPADQLHVSLESNQGDANQTHTVDVWIEPVGGQWRPLLAGDGSTLDLGIVAVHAALMRKKDNSGTEVVMYSPPRERENGVLKQNPQWSASNPERTER
jgi:hypothetical protein